MSLSRGLAGHEISAQRRTSVYLSFVKVVNDVLVEHFF